MKSVKINQVRHSLTGTLSFPGDKSLSHRAIMFGALAEGTSHFTNVLSGEDCVATRKAFEAMGVRIEVKTPTEIIVHGVGLHGLKASRQAIDCGNSGTSMRLLAGILAGQAFESVLTGDSSLSSRPMRRVTDWLKQMGASIEGKENGNFAPLKIRGGKLKAIGADLPVASAQVKSAILLAGLYADGVTSVNEPEKSRDHTEKFLEYFGAKIGKGEPQGRPFMVSIKGGQKIQAHSFEIAGDVSSAAFFMVASALVPKSKLTHQDILGNPTRIGVVNILGKAGACLFTKLSDAKGPETTMDFTVENGPLKNFEIKKDELPSLIDEVPILCVLATQANGRSIIRDAAELRVKETDRIQSMVGQLSKMGARIKAEGDSILVEGPTPLQGTVVQSFKDHRTAMSLIVAGMIAEGETRVEDVECIDTSFPGFFELLKKLGIHYQLC